MLTKCQEKALEAMKKGYNVHLFGEGGTGKSFVINEFLNSLTESERDKTIITAPTGIAALNVNGVTIHRAFKVPIDNAIRNSEVAWIDKADSTAIILRVYDDEEE